MLDDEEYCTDEIVRRIYPVAKLPNVLFACALTEHLPASVSLIVSNVSPGYCYSQLRRSAIELTSSAIRFWLMDFAFGRMTEQGARQLVWVALGPDGKEGMHASWMRCAYIGTQGIKELSDFVISQDDVRAQEKVYVSTTILIMLCVFNIG
ncbi:hypothetical protein EIP86_002364 [Pleurotus ostreatoroseus]|nr:hypothetical protein EIP86_002364 [Pleurotus ostreatoroseus]